MNLPPVSSRLFKLPMLAPSYVTAEGWHPNEPFLQTCGGTRYLLGSATFIFLDGRQVLRDLIHSADTPNAVLRDTIKAIKDLPRLKIEECEGAQGEWPPLDSYRPARNG